MIGLSFLNGLAREEAIRIDKSNLHLQWELMLNKNCLGDTQKEKLLVLCLKKLLFIMRG